MGEFLRVLIHGYRLDRTCMACPEQYDLYEGDEVVAYFRLRHGDYTVQCSGPGGVLVYSASPKGDGIFDDEERFGFLLAGVEAVIEYYLNDQYSMTDW